MQIGKGTKAGQDLAARAERIIGLQNEQIDLKAKVKELTEQIAEEFADAASTGFNAKAMREAIKRLRMTPDERQAAFDFEQELEIYCAALDALPPSHSGASDSPPSNRPDAPTAEQTPAVDLAKAAAVEKLRDVVATVQINGGPEVPFSTFESAVKRVKPRRDGNVIAAIGEAIDQEIAAQ